MTVRVDETGDGRRAIVVEAPRGTFIPVRSWVTAYPVHLIEHALRVKGAHIIDEIMRDEAPLYVENQFKWGIFSYVDPADFAGCRLLDFGCGSGASVMVLSRMLPKDTAFVGVDLVAEYVEFARERARWHGIADRAAFFLSPESSSLPEGIGDFDFVLLSAVFEHLLPQERCSVLPLAWRHLKPGGVLFLDQTPYRWFPIETHTTGFPFLNYLPDPVAYWTARTFSKRVRRHETWSDLLRRGIRGGTAGEILGIVNEEDAGAELLTPCRQGVRDAIDLWFQLSSASRSPGAKRTMSHAFRMLKAVTGLTISPSLSLAIRKSMDD